MATGKRKRYDGVETYLDQDLTAGQTTISFKGALSADGGVAIDSLNAGEYIALSILDINYVLYEIVHLVSYTQGATTGTVERAQEGTTARDHFKGQKVVHAPTADDFFDVQEHLEDPNAHQAFISNTVSAAIAAAINAHKDEPDPHTQYVLENSSGTATPLPPNSIVQNGSTITVQQGGKIIIQQGGELIVEGDLYIQGTGRLFINGRQLYIAKTAPASPTADMVWLQTFGP
jgi:hypothetical protein